MKFWDESFEKMNSFVHGENHISIYFTSSDLCGQIFLKTGCTLISNYSSKIINYQEKVSYFSVEKPDRCYIDHVIKVNITHHRE